MKTLNLVITCTDEELNREALKLSESLNLPFVGSMKTLSKNIKDFDELPSKKFFLVVSKDLIYLKQGLGDSSKPIFSDFLKWSKQSHRVNLVKSLRGLPKKSLFIDATAGLGKDALLFSSFVDKLILIERVPWIHALLEDGLKRQNKLIPSLKKIEIVCSDSKDYLLKLRSNPDAIYLDPMFENMGKSKAKREVQALRELVVENSSEELLEISLKKAKNRVIVKRHRKAQSLAGIEPTYSLKGKTIRYDVYSLKLS